MDIPPFEQYGPDITKSWLHEQQICVISMKGKSSTEVTQQWTQVVIDTITTWPQGKAIYLLLDFSDPLFVLTQSARSAIVNVFNRFTTKQSSNIAVAVHAGMSYLIARAVIPRARIPENAHVRVFTGRTAAVEWLETLLSGEDES